MFYIIKKFGTEFTIQFCGIFVTTVFLPRKFKNQPRPSDRPSVFKKILNLTHGIVPLTISNFGVIGLV